MSFSRFPMYVWGDGQSLHLWIQEGCPTSVAYDDPVEPEDYGVLGGIAINEKQFVALALAVMSNYTPKQLSGFCRQVAKPNGPYLGNFSLDPHGLERLHKAFTPKGKSLFPDGFCPHHEYIVIQDGECWCCAHKASSGLDSETGEETP